MRAFYQLLKGGYMNFSAWCNRGSRLLEPWRLLGIGIGQSDAGNDKTHFNPSMDTLSHTQLSVEWNNLSIPKLQRLYRWSLGVYT